MTLKFDITRIRPPVQLLALHGSLLGMAYSPDFFGLSGAQPDSFFPKYLLFLVHLAAYVFATPSHTISRCKLTILPLFTYPAPLFTYQHEAHHHLC